MGNLASKDHGIDINIQEPYLQMMLFDCTFSMLDWAPSLPFAVVFLALYLSLHSVVYRLLLLGTRFRSAGYHKQSSVLTDVMQSALSAFIWYTVYTLPHINIFWHTFCSAGLQ